MNDLGHFLNLKKTCTACFLEKEIVNFSKQARTKDGRRSHCKECVSKKSKEYHIENRDKILQYQKQYVDKNKEKVKNYRKKHSEENKEKLQKKNKQYYLLNKEKINNKNKKYYNDNKEKILENSKIYSNNKKKTDIKYKINCRISTAIYQHLKRFSSSKKAVGWEVAVGYSVNDLISHLEKLFKPEMNWGNYGTYWHIDHVKPKSLFKFSSFDDEDFKSCWALKNLQPLEAIENLKKSNKYKEEKNNE